MILVRTGPATSVTLVHLGLHCFQSTPLKRPIIGQGALLQALIQIAAEHKCHSVKCKFHIMFGYAWDPGECRCRSPSSSSVLWHRMLQSGLH